MGTLVSTVIFGTCRQFFASPRPYWNHPELFNGMTEKAYGMPSGHTQNATLFWGLIAYSLKNKGFWLIAAALIVLTGISRLYLGLHFPTQIIAGLTLGILLLSLCIALEQPVIDFIHCQTLWKKLLLVMTATLLPIFFILIFREIFNIGSGSGSALPYAKFMRFNGLLTGCAVGLLFVSAAPPSIKLFITRAIPGAISVIFIWVFMPALNDLKGIPLLYYPVRFCEFFLLSLWATCLWPQLHKYLFSRFNSL